MFCKNCGKELKDKAKFCAACGFVVPSNPGAQTPVPPGTPPAQGYIPPQPAPVPPSQQPQAPIPSSQQPAVPVYQQPAQPVPPAPGQPAYQQPQPAPGQPVQQPQAIPTLQQQPQTPQTSPVPPAPGRPAYQQPPAPPQGYAQYGQPGQPAPPPKKSKTPIFIAAGAAAAALLIVLLVIVPFAGGKGTDKGGIDEDDFSVEIFVDKPVGRELPFEPTDGGFLTYDPDIAMIEVNQCLSYGFDTASGEFYTMDNFVAGKDTAIFVILNDQVSEKSEITLKIEKDGETVTTLLPLEVIDNNTILFQPRDMADVNNWAQGAYTFTVTIDDKYAERTTNFFDTMHLKILAVPVLAHYSGRVVPCGDAWKTASQMLIAVYPIARDNVEYILGPEIDLSDPMYDLNTREGRFQAWKALCNLQTPNKDYTMIVGFVEESMDYGEFTATGFTCGEPGNFVCGSKPGTMKTVVHEIAHCYLIGDEYNGGGGAFNTALNEPPYGYIGWDITIGKDVTVTGTNEKVRPAFEFGLDAEGSVVYPEQRAYWAEGRQHMGLSSSYMGSSGCPAFEYWTTSDLWNHLFKVFTSQAAGSGSAGGSSAGGEYWGQCYNCYNDVYDPLLYVSCTSCQMPVLLSGRVNNNNEFSCEGCGATNNLNDYVDDDLLLYCENCQSLIYYPAFVQFNSGNGEISSADQLLRAINIRGYFEADDTFVADPWYAYEAAPSEIITNKDGEYAVIVYGPKGERLAVSYFNAVSRTQVTTEKEAFFVEDTNIPIDVVTKFPDNAAKIVIQKGEKEIFSRSVSKNAPVVAFKGLSANQELSNKTTLSWEASDADGDDMLFEIWYCPKEEDFYLVASDIKGTSYEANLTDFPGSNSGYFRILATDGVLTGQSDSPKVKVPYKAPEILTDTSKTRQIKITDGIQLEVQVYDAQDGRLFFEEIQWFLDGEYFFKGSYVFRFPYTLKEGTYTLTCKATNSGGMTASKDFVYEIINDESSLPDDWSRPEVVSALRLGYTMPLDRLDAPVTRGEYAWLMFTLFSRFPQGEHLPFPDSPPEIKDCSGGSIEWMVATLLVGWGVMDAPDGMFSPQKSLTEREALEIMYKIIENGRAQDFGLDYYLSEAEYLKIFEDMGMFDETHGPAGYHPDQKLSRKMTLVRIIRFINDDKNLDRNWGIDYDNR